MHEILSDTTKFRKASNQDIYDISRKIETRIRNYLRNQLHKPGLITDEQYKRLYPNGSHISIMYGLPKVHKKNNPMRPICSAIGTSTYELSKFVANIIKPASFNNKFDTDLDNTFNFVNQIKDIKLEGKKMVSFDVRSLFTNIPIKKTIKVCLDRLYRGDPRNKPYIPEKVLEKLLQMCVCDNTFIFNNTVYQQIDGVAMGSSLGPLLANIYMAHLEEEHFLKNVMDFTPSYYRRYVDDTFCLMKEDCHINQFLSYINSIDPNIQFDVEQKNNGKLSFLDTVVSRSDNNSYPDISTKIKSTDRGLLYHFSSFIPNIYKNNLIYCLVYRVYHIASSYDLFDKDIKLLKKKFISNGFPAWQFHNIVSRFLSFIYNPKPAQPIAPKKTCLLVLPYLGPLSIYVNRKIKGLVNKFYPTIGLRIVYKRGLSIRNLFSYKDQLPLKYSSGVVYYICCKSCGLSQAYIGKTINTVHERFYGANGHLNPSIKKSALLEHLGRGISDSCEFDFNTIKIIDKCEYDLKLRYAESIHLKLSNQSLNTQDRSIPLNII